jgi:hypothetical protein
MIMMRKTAFLLLLSGSLCFADTLIMKDGSRHDGMLESTNERYVIFSEQGMTHRYSRANVQSVEFNPVGLSENDNRYNNGPNNNAPYNNGPNSSNYNSGNYNSGPVNDRYGMTLPAGTEIAVLTNENIDSQSANEGQLFPAEVQQDVVDPSGRVIIPKGSQAELTIRQVNEGGATGTNELALGLDSVNVNGNTYRVSTEDVQQQGDAGLGKNKRTGEYVGGGAVLGTLIGAIAGGGKGAAIGAVTGAAAGAGAQVLTRGKSVKVPAESTLRFRLDQPLELRH